MSQLIAHTSDDTFDADVLQSAEPVLVDFWAEWCGPCRMVAPILDELAGEYEGQATIAKLNVDENREAAARFGIRSIPTILFFKDGTQVDQIIGALSKAALKAKVQQHL